MNNILNFPTDFVKKSHPVSKHSFQWTPKGKMPVFISIVGGAFGLYGDGQNTFELMIGDKVHGYLSAEQVNEKINEVLLLICG